MLLMLLLMLLMLLMEVCSSRLVYYSMMYGWGECSIQCKIHVLENRCSQDQAAGHIAAMKIVSVVLVHRRPKSIRLERRMGQQLNVCAVFVCVFTVFVCGVERTECKSRCLLVLFRSLFQKKMSRGICSPSHAIGKSDRNNYLEPRTM
jgi:hypothetical protein